MTAAVGRPPLPLPDHGSRARYQRGCRCEPCRARNARYQATYRSAGALPRHGVQLELPPHEPLRIRVGR